MALVPKDPQLSCGSDSLDVHAKMMNVGHVGDDGDGDGCDGADVGCC